jgi:hypothetical protein
MIMTRRAVLLSVPGLRDIDLPAMPNLVAAMAGGERAALTPSFPCVTWPVQTNMLTGHLPAAHGVVANGFYWRGPQRVQMWTANNDVILVPQIWDRLHQQQPSRSSAAWFPMLSKGCGADYICMPAPVHNPDGSESLWCYTRPQQLYGELRDAYGHFPLHHFWGPLANISSTAWIAKTAAHAAQHFHPDFFYIYLPHLDYAAQRDGPDSIAARRAVVELDGVIGTLLGDLRAALGADVLLLAASEYVLTPVDHVLYPNRLLRNAGFLRVQESEQGELLDLRASRAWALVDHQFSHVFVRDADPRVCRQVSELFRRETGVSEVLAAQDRAKYHLDHERSGEVILISTPDSWQAYYWWLSDDRAPGFARAVDIHRKPGYDPVELHVCPQTRSIPLDATRVRGSHGAPAESAAQQGVLLASQAVLRGRSALRDTDVCQLILARLS